MHVSHTGKLLVATPRLIDPNFYMSVILVLQHDEEGSVGLVLNRPTTETVADHLPEWGTASNKGVIHSGGPVEPEVAIAIAVTSGGEPTGVPGLSMVDLSAGPEAGLGDVRIYSGYSGWGPNQLDDEVDTGSWYVAQASPDDPFASYESLWRDVLRRQPGQLSVVSTFTDRSDLN